MTFYVFLAFFLVLAAPSLQQGGHGHIGGYRDHAYCYDRCNNAYQSNHNNYFVDQCNCNGYNFPGHNNCGHIDASCIANSYDATYNVYAWTYDHRSNSCKKVSVLSRCVDSYTPQRNIFQSQQACARACEPNRGY
ncbi:cold and drought-regulated protein CORA-like isoform X2 [Biomphalaria pfeifferi]|uniref:Cold and drought-regulated protein CORA-like isoform X2 n=1 Tax=Biomphalaria pfeifferi TaxID=112525 RepID=A0AAD8BHU8_BIOPF|nr:cold and drought-regulated protein CORA-like isoform X2 [Biomphalaria pfeifferi]